MAGGDDSDRARWEVAATVRADVRGDRAADVRDDVRADVRAEGLPVARPVEDVASDPRAPAGATVGDAAWTLPAGTIWGKYRILDVIGRGGMGVVFRAEHVDLGLLHALKTLSPAWAHHPLARARFLKEARAAARINHPHVVKVFDCGTQDGIPFFVMEHLDGEDLAATLARTVLTVEQTAGIMLAVCAAISEMHEAGLIHRDLKPGNIFLARDKLGNIVPTVLDFGIAKPLEPGASGHGTQEGVVVGTARYISPEQLSDLPAGERSDQYALGVVLYQCVTGRVPFDGASAIDIFKQIARFHFLPPSAARPDLQLPAEIEAVILTAMSARPADRFPSVYQLGKALFPFASGRHQALWADYYARAPASTKATLSAAIPLTASTEWLRRPPTRAGAAVTARSPRAGAVPASSESAGESDPTSGGASREGPRGDTVLLPLPDAPPPGKHPTRAPGHDPFSATKTFARPVAVLDRPRRWVRPFPAAVVAPVAVGLVVGVWLLRPRPSERRPGLPGATQTMSSAPVRASAGRPSSASPPPSPPSPPAAPPPPAAPAAEPSLAPAQKEPVRPDPVNTDPVRQDGARRVSLQEQEREAGNVAAAAPAAAPRSRRRGPHAFHVQDDAVIGANGRQPARGRSDNAAAKYPAVGRTSGAQYPAIQ